LYEEAARHPSISTALFERVISDSKAQDRKFRNLKFRHGLYQYALLHAARDSLRATQLLPNYSNVWLSAGEILSELWKLKESAKYYEKAYELDPSLTDSLSPVVERLRKRQELLDNARAYGWSEDTLRLALDVAG
jgi:tetratricopeptide (TPR) repeat protein